MSDKDTLSDARDAYRRCAVAEAENRKDALDDLKFARLGEQWPEQVRRDRERDQRPCLTINKMPAFIRQVTNDVRQNRPAIKVRPVDDDADPVTAEIYNGLIRNIETQSNADVAYDTAADFAVTMGFGYFRVSIDFASDDTFDKDILIQTLDNPFAVHGDPDSACADSSDWNVAFVTEWMPKTTFQARYKGAEESNFDSPDFGESHAQWLDDENVLVAEHWYREEYERDLLLLSNGKAMFAEMAEAQGDMLEAMGIQVVQSRKARSHRVRQCLMTGAEVLSKNEWAGRYIPIVPVYGEVVNVEGKRYLRSLIRDAKDAQRMFNFWRTAATESVALAPKTPFIGPDEAFTGVDAGKWATANTQSACLHRVSRECAAATPALRRSAGRGAARGAERQRRHEGRHGLV